MHFYFHVVNPIHFVPMTKIAQNSNNWKLNNSIKSGTSIWSLAFIFSMTHLTMFYSRQIMWNIFFIFLRKKFKNRQTILNIISFFYHTTTPPSSWNKYSLDTKTDKLVFNGHHWHQMKNYRIRLVLSRLSVPVHNDLHITFTRW